MCATSIHHRQLLENLIDPFLEPLRVSPRLRADRSRGHALKDQLLVTGIDQIDHEAAHFYPLGIRHRYAVPASPTGPPAGSPTPTGTPAGPPAPTGSKATREGRVLRLFSHIDVVADEKIRISLYSHEVPGGHCLFDESHDALLHKLVWKIRIGRL